DGPDITIAFGPTGLNMSRLLEPIVKCFANRSYAFREGYFVNVVPFPESIQQLLPAHDAFAVFDQVNKHLKRPVGQGDVGTTAAEHAFARLQHEVTQQILLIRLQRHDGLPRGRFISRIFPIYFRTYFERESTTGRRPGLSIRSAF